MVQFPPVSEPHIIYPENDAALSNTKSTYKCYLSSPTLREASYIPNPSPEGERS